MKPKTSIVWSISKKEFSSLVKHSNSIGDICRFFGIGKKGGNYNTIKRRIDEEKLDVSHFRQCQPQVHSWISKNEFLKILPTLQSKHNKFIKKKILEFSLIEEKCKLCGQTTFWNKLPLTLFLDHINGNSSDNHLENLRFLCPNCHTQTETHSMGQRKLKSRFCIECQSELSTPHGYLCHSCGNKRRRKVERPTKESLQKMVETMPMVDIGKLFDVSDNAVRRWCLSMNIPCKRGRGYWKSQ